MLKLASPRDVESLLEILAFVLWANTFGSYGEELERPVLDFARDLYAELLKYLESFYTAREEPHYYSFICQLQLEQGFDFQRKRLAALDKKLAERFKAPSF
ncbi:hypothetical protein MGLY_32220 [Neomoorella glycerini]|uniref:Uncharacterized protein n=1 Tax=Neomoorella glycerini TaxID=55779 RepID=A0A6I5ZQU1_9FIRM|nr:hypothetical protein [Moorella glycerini]QGP92364.1 hypothetical protein MGLY_17390 [Moorella glycerini]QGP93197.1 hypothetical protein MGLY_26030 [Moorella glycerini]QGP93799.1 hypothetical protein MGLY_32220 [Moorella glycerini]